MPSSSFSSFVAIAVLLSTAELAEARSSQPSGSHKRPRQHHVNEYYARQVMALTSSSYDYWWPYPPATQTQTNSPTNSPVPTNTLIVEPLATNTPEVAFSFDSSTSSIPASSISASSALSSSSLSSSSSPFSSSSAPPSSSQSVVSISALPPSNTSIPANSHRKLEMVSSTNLLYIVPACGVGGLVIGGLTAWLVYGCIARRSLRKRGDLIAGPEYRPPTPSLAAKVDHGEDEDDEWAGNEKHRVEELDDGVAAMFVGNLRGKGDRVGGEDEDEDEDQPESESAGFLHPGTAQTRPLRVKSVASTAAPSRGRTMRSDRSPSPTPSGRTSIFFDRPDSGDEAPWETLRHKSIKRGILERLRDEDSERAGSGSKDRVKRRAWQSHGRHDSDIRIPDNQVSLSRATSMATASLSRAASTVSTAMGFRILSESPAPTPFKEQNFAWPSVEEDKYTRVPRRVARSRSPEKPMPSPVKYTQPLRRAASPDGPSRSRGRKRKGQSADGRLSRKPTIEEQYRSVLPRSPPCISSPVLHEALCFTPPSQYTETVASFAAFGVPDEQEPVKRGRRH
ncbi:unnamed protein product [Mycena citricolor]|uniref:Transmembrane protein n=1 Tax=Mycena citricolor TaxID=2018698 RepID=A0AAD2GQC9_9AGAR|nr:unnamed protein product [Mycena citricolor]CAK5261973.1 unnamed protein product [Mycena citricolor]